MSRVEAEAICFTKDGHKMVSLLEGEAVDPQTKQILHKYAIVCEQCGCSLAWVKKSGQYLKQKPNRGKDDGKFHGNK